MNTSSENGTKNKLPFDEELCERYLFGELSDSEQERFEIAYFTDDSFFSNFLAVKDELLDLYSRNELDPEKRRRMEPHFLATRPRSKGIEESKDFIDSISRIADRRERRAHALPAETAPRGAIESFRRFFTPLKLAAAGILMLAFGVGLWIVVKPRPYDDLVDSLNASGEPPGNVSVIVAEPDGHESDADPQHVASQTDEALSNLKRDEDKGKMAVDAKTPEAPDKANQGPGTGSGHQLPQIAQNDPDGTKLPDVAVKTDPIPVPDLPRLPEEKPPSSGTRIETVTLESTSRSVSRRNTAEIGTATQSVVVRMIFGGDAYPSYSVRVSAVGGGTVWQASNLKTAMNDAAKSLAVTIPARALTGRDYIVVVEGKTNDGQTETVREYYLNVIRR